MISRFPDAVFSGISLLDLIIDPYLTCFNEITRTSISTLRKVHAITYVPLDQAQDPDDIVFLLGKNSLRAKCARKMSG